MAQSKNTLARYEELQAADSNLKESIEKGIEDQARRRYDADLKLNRLVGVIANDVYPLRNDIIKRLPHVKSVKDEPGLLNAVLATGCLNSLGYQRFDRYMKPSDIDMLLEKWNPILGTELRSTALSYMAETLCQV